MSARPHDAGEAAMLAAGAGPAEVLIDGRNLSLDDVARLAEGKAEAWLSPAAEEAIARARQVVEKVLAEDRVVYGISTGFGALKDRKIPSEDLAALQRNLVRSHAVGVGEPFPTPVVRAMLALRANALAAGHSGVRLELVQLLLAMLNRKVHPIVPSQGSVGASGDLSPLSHLALVLMGEGRAEYDGVVWPAAEALDAAGLKPLALEAKEGLALINGTQAMGALGVLGVRLARRLVSVADLACAMSVEALHGSAQAFRPEVHRLRPHRGQSASARNLWRLLADSEIAKAHADCGQVQDAYSLRCAPQIHGASRDALAYVEEALSVELNSVTDNPLLFPDTEEAISAGHFHGQPLALPLDHLGLAMAELANVAERRIERLVNPALSNGLPAFLAPDPGLNSGFMVAQYTAAALVSENKVLVHPASADSIPTSANQEDHVSMGTIAGRKAHRILEHLVQVLAIELLVGAQGLELRGDTPPAPGVKATFDFVRSLAPKLEADRELTGDLAAVAAAVRDGRLLQAVEGAIGPLE
jgi:histidine ammonia-lyase